MVRTVSSVACSASAAALSRYSFRKATKLCPVICRNHRIKWLSAHYTEELRVADAAGVCSFSASHFMRWFRQMTGQSFVAFLNEYRLNAAAEALQATDETVLTIASRCGFENLSYFNRAFKAHFGMTPREYRKK